MLGLWETDEERDALALRCLARQPDARELAAMLGLDGAPIRVVYDAFQAGNKGRRKRIKKNEKGDENDRDE